MLLNAKLERHCDIRYCHQKSKKIMCGILHFKVVTEIPWSLRHIFVE
jgi:hypothetical protein